MKKHEVWLRKKGLGPFIDNRPAFLTTCDWGRNGLSEDVFVKTICPKCSNRVECEGYFQPLAKALESALT